MEDLQEALLEFQAAEWARWKADKKAADAYEAHRLILSKIRRCAKWTASLKVRNLRLQMLLGHVGPGVGAGLRYKLHQAKEGKVGAPAPGGAIIKCWEQAPSTAPRMLEAKAGKPTARRKRKTSTREALLPSVGYASSRIGTRRGIGQRAVSGSAQTANRPSR